MLVGRRGRTDEHQPVVGRSREGEFHVVHGQAVRFSVDLDTARTAEREVLEVDVAEFADLRAEVVVPAQFKVRLVIELELADVRQVAEYAIADRTVERRAAGEPLDSG
jgi:hypothetical protein